MSVVLDARKFKPNASHMYMWIHHYGYRGWNELLGIFVGHVYFFLMFKYPQDFGGAQFISTPQIL